MKAIQLEYDKDFEKRCQYASEGGFRHIGIAFSYMEDKTDRAFDEASERISNVTEKYNLKVVQTHPSYYDLRTSSEILDEDVEHQMLRAIDVTGELGIPWIVFHTRVHYSNGYSKELSFLDNSKAINRYLERAEKFNTGIAIENLFGFEEHYMFGSKYEELAELCDSFNSEKVGVCWDTGHANLMPFDQYDAIKYLGKRIKCTHIHNNYGQIDYHLTPPDNGNIDWYKVMKAFHEVGYTGPLTLETHCRYNEDQLLKDFLRYNYECVSFLQGMMK